ncbi:hypothetical protein MLD38_007645 [Melastoma candidum]|uniref:Uncharacterized protein n=1 Tax=Melastoma candidum TaxID=119954 RepID=A0ACB9RRR4_9MYRT|nr:hypothetical protein MLD38_007645 [Melastoma candidum]
MWSGGPRQRKGVCMKRMMMRRNGEAIEEEVPCPRPSYGQTNQENQWLRMRDVGERGKDGSCPDWRHMHVLCPNKKACPAHCYCGIALPSHLILKESNSFRRNCGKEQNTISLVFPSIEFPIPFLCFCFTMKASTKGGDFGSHLYRAPVFDQMMPPSVLYPSFPHKSKLSAAAADDMELSIFDAEKYFNETNDHLENGDLGKGRFQLLHDPPALPRISSASSSTDVYGRNYRTQSFRSYVTPTASSEASWNSQTGLLSNPPGSVPVSIRDPSSERKRGMGSPRWQRFRTKCPCLGKKSVSINERNLSSEPRSVPLMNNIRSRLQPNGHAQKAADAAVCESEQQNPAMQAKPYDEEIGKSCSLNSHRRYSSELGSRFPSEIGCHRSSIIAGRPFSDATSAGFTFPVLKASISSTTATSPSSPPIKNLLNGLTISSPSPINATYATNSLPLPDDLPRDSLEVFQPSDSAAFSRHKNQIPQPPKNQFFAVPPIRLPMDNDDAASDASSDLFEIESFSTQSTAYPIHRQRDSLDEARPRFSTNTCSALSLHYNGDTTAPMLDDDHDRSLATTPRAMMESAYEPSEASVAWSVTTAEGPLGDRGSVVTSYSVSASDVEEFTRLQLKLHRELELSGNGIIPGQGQGRNLATVDDEKRRSGSNNKGGLLSCRSEKAVSVGPNPVNMKAVAGENGGNAAQGQNKINAAGGTTNNYAIMQPLTTAMSTRHVSSRPPPVSKTGPHHSARVSMAFAT